MSGDVRYRILFGYCFLLPAAERGESQRTAIVVAVAVTVNAPPLE